MTRRVVVTGYGAVSPLGNSVEVLWDQIKAGKSGIKRIESDAFSGINTQIGGYMTDFDPSLYLDKKERGRYDLRSEEHTSELQSRGHLVCRLLLEKKKS